MLRLTVPLCTAGVALLVALVCCISGICIVGSEHSERSQLWRSNFTVTVVVAAYVLVPSIVGGVTTALSCHDIGNSGRYMTYALDVECGSSEHRSAAALGLFLRASF